MRFVLEDLWWLIVVVVAVLWNLVPKVLEASKRAQQPAAPKPRTKRARPSRPQPVIRATLPPEISGERQAATERIRRARQQVEQPAKPQAAVPTRAAETIPTPAPKAPSPQPLPAPHAEARPARASAWAEVLRNKQTLRQVIISAEILGPPKGA